MASSGNSMERDSSSTPSSVSNLFFPWGGPSLRIRLYLGFFLAVILTLVALDTFLYPDEGIWCYIGMHWAEGRLLPYRDMVENKTPGIFILYALAYRTWGLEILPVRLMGVAAIVVASLFLFEVAAKWGGQRAGILAALLLGCAMGWDGFDGEATAVTETFLVFFSTLALLCLTRALGEGEENDPRGRRNKGFWIFLAGLSLGGAIAFKQIAVMTTLGLFLFYLFAERAEKKWRRVLSTGALLFVGILIATAVSLLPILGSGVTLKEYGEGAWLILFEPGTAAARTLPADRAHFWKQFGYHWGSSRMRFHYVFIPLFLLFDRSLRERKVPIAGLLLWIAMEFLGVNASGQFYGHQFKPILPAFALACGLGLEAGIRWIAARRFPAGLRGNVFPIVLFLVVGLWLPYHRIYAGVKEVWHPTGDPDRIVGEWIRDHAEEGDQAFVFASAHSKILAFSCLPAPSRYFNLIFWNNPKVQRELEETLFRSPPRFLVMVEGVGNPSPPWIHTLLTQEYTLAFTYHRFRVYERERERKERHPSSSSIEFWGPMFASRSSVLFPTGRTLRDGSSLILQEEDSVRRSRVWGDNNGTRSQIRTEDLLIKNQLLYRLS